MSMAVHRGMLFIRQALKEVMLPFHKARDKLNSPRKPRGVRKSEDGAGNVTLSAVLA